MRVLLITFLRISVEAPPLSDWCAEGALDLWFKDKKRRIEHKEKYVSRTSTKSTNDESSNDEDETGLVFDLESVVPKRRR